MLKGQIIPAGQPKGRPTFRVRESRGSTARLLSPLIFFLLVACWPPDSDDEWLLATLLISPSSLCDAELVAGTIQSSRCPLALKGITSTFAGPGAGSSTKGDADGASNVARFNNPAGITTDGVHLYVSDLANHKIRKIEIVTGTVSTIAGPAAGCYSSCASGDADGTGNAARFNQPIGITTDGTNLYVADAANNKIRKVVLSTGEVSTFAGPGPGSSTAGSSDGIGTAARFSFPYGIVSISGYLYVFDFGSHRIRRIDLNTAEVVTIAGSSSGDADGTGTSAEFNGPAGLASDSNSLYIADSQNNKIRKLSLATNAVSTILGPETGNTMAGDLQGDGHSARFNNPRGLSCDGSSLYIGDSGNNKLRKAALSTLAVTTLAGPADGNISSGSSDGSGADARFLFPQHSVSDG